jgi:hypothetical protein
VRAGSYHSPRRVVHAVSMKLITSMNGEAEPLNGATVAKTVALRSFQRYRNQRSHRKHDHQGCLQQALKFLHSTILLTSGRESSRAILNPNYTPLWQVSQVTWNTVSQRKCPLCR